MGLRKKTELVTLQEAAEWFRGRDNFLILTHNRPDGDTLGSACGLCRVLRELGKTAFVLNNPQITKRYSGYMEGYWSEDFKPDFVISADIAAEGLFPQNAKEYLEKVDLAIDHHPSNSGFAKASLIDDSCAACGEIIYALSMELLGKVSREAATLIFIAVTTDCGCFRYGNTTARTHFIASKLIEVGAPGTEINKKLFRTKSKSRVDIELDILNGLEFTRSGKVATVVVTQAMIKKTGAEEDDLEDIAAIHGQIEGVVISITIRENEDLTAKISVRSNHEVDSGAICALLGGGGHFMAAGASLDCGVWEAKERVLKAVDEIFI